MKKNWTNFIKVLHLLGILLLVYIVLQINITKVWSQLKNFSWVWFFFYLTAIIGVLIFKSIRWKISLSALGIKIPFYKVFKITTITIYWGVLTPGKVGEFGKLIYLKKDNIPLADGITSIFLDRVYDVLLLFIMGFISLLFFIDQIVPDFKMIIYFADIFVLLILIIFFARKGIWQTLKKIFSLFLSPERYNIIVEEWTSVKERFQAIVVKTFLGMAAASVLSTALYYFQIYFVAKGLGADVPFLYLVMCMSIGSIVALLPISIGGLGTREGIYIFLLSRISIPAETAVLISLIDSLIFALLTLSIIISIIKILDKTGINKLN